MIKVIGVIGAGQMGSGVAEVCALGKFDVRLVDIDKARTEAAMKAIDRTLRHQVDRGRITAQARDAALKQITTGLDYKLLKDCDLIIETVTENEEVKRAVFEKLQSILKPEAIITTNTSSISITRLAASTDRPARFMGMHFMNPAPLIELVELIRGIATEDDTFQTIRELTRKLGKTPAVSEDFPAFIVNRILQPMINEAVYTLYEGVGSVEAIDTAMKLGPKHPMGPLELADFIGLDVCLAVMQVLYEGLADSKYRPCPLLVKYVEAGWVGRKAGRGFYDYSGDVPIPTR